MGSNPEGGAGQRRLVLVAGVGRSGTSLFTSILGQLGFHVPQPEVQADSTNPKGFGEPRWAVDFHRRLLRERRVSVWDSRPAAWQETAHTADEPETFHALRSWLAVQFVGRDQVVVKDPRIGWFLPLWERAANDLGIETSFATLLRHPAEAVSSAIKWYGTWQSPA
ncbi:MAG: sulfotransferase family protein, partial [Actinomycetes bacterium]